MTALPFNNLDPIELSQVISDFTSDTRNSPINLKIIIDLTQDSLGEAQLYDLNSISGRLYEINCYSNDKFVNIFNHDAPENNYCFLIHFNV